MDTLLEGGFISGLAVREVHRNQQPVQERDALFLQLNLKWNFACPENWLIAD